MKTILLTLTALVSGLGIAGLSGRQDPAQDMPKPGPEHERILNLAGTWDAVITITAPDGSGQQSKGSLRTEKLGAFHTVDHFEGELMGMPFHGHGVNSYCPVRKQHVTFWSDSMSPSPILLTGTYDESKKELRMSGESAGMSGKLEKMRTVIKIESDDRYVFSLFGPGPDGEEMQHMMIEYTRKK